jgi:putative GTP pyrophosphokinase
MRWAKPKEYSKAQINSAGRIISSSKSTNNGKVEATKILDNWRAVHSYPMHIFKKRLKKCSERVDRRAISVQRLKRSPSVIKKLQREYYGNKPTMNLSQMQDIAGCRAVVSTVDMVNKLYKDHYLKGDLKHEMVNVKDYILDPKEDGYRSIHLVYKYKSDKGKKEYNGLLVEIQIRSKLQHLWATAIETVDFFTRQAIKISEGDKEWSEFFKLVSSAFAKWENCPSVKNTPTKEKELFLKIKEKEKKLQVIKSMKGWTKAMQFLTKSEVDPKMKFHLLSLDIKGETLSINSYSDKSEKKALEDYSRVEKRNKDNKEYDVVLVGADTTQDLKKAYPNYFVDTREFLGHLQKIVNKY